MLRGNTSGSEKLVPEFEKDVNRLKPGFPDRFENNRKYS